MTKNSSDRKVSHFGNKLDILVQQLYDLYFHNRRREYSIYALIFLICLIYAVTSEGILGRTEQTIVLECLILAFVFLSAFSIIYIIRAISPSTTSKYNQQDHLQIEAVDSAKQIELTIDQIPQEDFDQIKALVIAELSSMDEASLRRVARSKESLTKFVAKKFYMNARLLGYIIAVPMAWSALITESLWEGISEGFKKGWEVDRKRSDKDSKDKKQ